MGRKGYPAEFRRRALDLVAGSYGTDLLHVFLNNKRGDGTFEQPPAYSTLNGIPAPHWDCRGGYGVHRGYGENVAPPDLNGDGKITSGAELFGPQSGNGYAELAKYDADGNRWIDENDAVFSRLRIWSPAAEGSGTVSTLQKRNVAALSLDHLATPFELRTGGNDSLGAVRSSGVYLTEGGQAVNGRGDTPNMHDVLTGSQPDGTAFAAGEDRTCKNYTSSTEGAVMVGHHDRQGLRDDDPSKSWNSSHPSRGEGGGCSQAALRGTGGAGLIYCFATN